ncbi:hypothetical protein F441_20261, partial [Phytophthora nicotianae CJ01A1]
RLPSFFFLPSLKMTFVVYPNPGHEFYRVIYDQAGEHIGIQARNPFINIQELVQTRTYTETELWYASLHIIWRNRLHTPFVSIFGNRAHAEAWAYWRARQDNTTYVRLESFTLQAEIPLISVANFVHAFGLDMMPCFWDEFLVPNGVLGEYRGLVWCFEVAQPRIENATPYVPPQDTYVPPQDASIMTAW